MKGDPAMMNEKLLKATEAFFEQFNGIDFDKYYICIYKNSTNQKQKVTDYIATFADEKRKLKMLFPEDAATASLVIVNKANTDIIGLLPSNSTVPVDVFGFSAGISSWYPGSPIYEFAKKTLKKETIEAYKLFKKSLITYGYFNDSDTEIFDYFDKQFIPRISEIMNRQILFADTLRANSARWAKLKKKITTRMKECGELDVIWKNEFALYLLTKRYYPDAEYQKRFDWLGQQSLDIYIPSRNTGIEYQGIQHYEPVDIFGGEEGFKTAKECDERKKELCAEHNVQLVEWPYTWEVEPNKYVEVLGYSGNVIGDNADNFAQGVYLDASELLINNDNSKENRTDKLIVAIEKLDMNTIAGELEIAVGNNDQEAIRDIINVISNDCEKKSINLLINNHINNEWFRNSILPQLVQNETFISKYFDTDRVNYYVLVVTVNYMKYVSAEMGADLLEKLVDKVVKEQKNIIKKKENILTKKAFIKRNLSKLPSEMCNIGMNVEDIMRVCEIFGIKIKMEDLFCNAMALFGQIKGYIVGDIPIFEHYLKDGKWDYRYPVFVNGKTYNVLEYVDSKKTMFFVRNENEDIDVNIDILQELLEIISIGILGTQERVNNDILIGPGMSEVDSRPYVEAFDCSSGFTMHNFYIDNPDENQGEFSDNTKESVKDWIKHNSFILSRAWDTKNI